MTTPQTHVSTAHTEGEDDRGVDTREWRRMAIGLIVGLVLAALVWFLFPSNAVDTVLQSPGAKDDVEYTQSALRAVAAVTILMGVWWMTEAIPLAATALLPLVIFPLAGVGAIKEVGAPYASATIFLFMGGFLIALSLQRWNLHRRLALYVVKLIGTSPKRLILGFMLATGFLSMWVSNTATAVVMLPIGTSVLALTAETVGGWDKQKKFATALMLGIAYSASIGSLGTLIGTPPNAFLNAYMADTWDVTLGFGRWMAVGVPLAAIFLIIAWLLLITVFKPEMTEIPGGRELIDDEIKALGPWTRPQIMTGIIFLFAAAAWVTLPLVLKEFENYDDAIVGIAAGILLFILPADNQRRIRLLDWETANEMPWDVLLLFGGGLSLSAMFNKSGLSLWIGEMAKGLSVLPTVLIVAAVAALVLFLTEITSNTATAATFIPIMGGVAVGVGLTAEGDINVLLLTIPVALAATCAFMLPVATPPNAIAYGSGYVKIGEMIKGGLGLNILGIFLITLTVYLLAVPIFGLAV
ncbi:MULTISPECIES: SLC13 family permease [Corynebacterium]|uniref:SLC13 family permease n=1 Tax=Corynebacterium TaxID=1716 RepID=UPI0008A2ECF4|nr:MULTISPECIES: DASS family sodium-coupled anion symporter [Corynebacterium]MBU5655006.1 DASS family sodium-coupled anion symporter [Corynebacterium aurimucosum]MDK6814439.1 DASS family sodium-coupled anion symporter [Corynebacterium sp. UMB6689]OFL23785.1 carboxylate transporter [Corynebacterium sp. HMSC062A03]OFP22613.1 carboxylate transporter [Corynebacterium sp. HMSC066C02]OFQ33981.1 carboxylate transporter [Corynebacterium sp. HMSC072D12]